MANEAWLIGEYVLRIIRDEEASDEPAREAAVVPLARSAGVRTPELVAVNLERDIAPMPYTIYRKAEGVLLGHLNIDPSGCSKLYCELGREIALLQAVKIEGEKVELLRKPAQLEEKKHVETARTEGKLSNDDAREICEWIDRLESMFGDKPMPVLIHRDIHPWNFFVHPDTLELTAIIDWGDAAYDGPCFEFASMPLVAIKPMMEGYVEAGGRRDEGMLARSLHAGLGLSCWEIVGLPEQDFLRQWWRMPLGGWPETRTFLENAFRSLD